MLSVQDLKFSYSARVLFNNASFVVGKNHKVAIVGPNGAGKSTLFKLISGELQPVQGEIKLLGTLSSVPQEVKNDPVMNNAKTARDYVNSEGSHPDHGIKRLLAGIGLAVDLEKSPRKLSGGQKTKLALVRALLMEPDILILDEPTNFMDTKGKKWFMRFLADYSKALMIVSHDIDMIDTSINKVLVINPTESTIEEYKGTYSDSIRLKRERDERKERERKIAEAKVVQMETSLTKLKRQSSKGGVRRRTQQRHRARAAREALAEIPREIKKVKITFPEPDRVGELPIRILGINKSYGEDQVLTNANISVKRGERLFLLGPNGSGKSTLIKIMTGILNPDEGEVVRGDNLKIGYYSQELEVLDLNKRVLEMAEEVSIFDTGKTRSILGSFLFDSTKVSQRITSLSGGEKTRLSIALLILSGSNLLILDEPTTYLDVLSQRIVLEALKKYSGTLVFTSHSEAFVKELSPERVFVLPEGKLTFWDEGYFAKVGEI